MKFWFACASACCWASALAKRSISEVSCSCRRFVRSRASAIGPAVVSCALVWRFLIHQFHALCCVPFQILVGILMPAQVLSVSASARWRCCSWNVSRRLASVMGLACTSIGAATSPCKHPGHRRCNHLRTFGGVRVGCAWMWISRPVTVGCAVAVDSVWSGVSVLFCVSAVAVAVASVARLTTPLSRLRTNFALLTRLRKNPRSLFFRDAWLLLCLAGSALLIGCFCSRAVCCMQRLASSYAVRSVFDSDTSVSSELPLSCSLVSATGLAWWLSAD